MIAQLVKIYMHTVLIMSSLHQISNVMRYALFCESALYDGICQHWIRGGDASGNHQSFKIRQARNESLDESSTNEPSARHDE